MPDSTRLGVQTLWWSFPSVTYLFNVFEQVLNIRQDEVYASARGETETKKGKAAANLRRDPLFWGSRVAVQIQVKVAKLHTYI
jgi:hypothetical protein